MGKPIELTWRTDSGKTVIEQCILIDEDDKIYVKGGSEDPVAIDTGNGLITRVLEMANDRVMFEDHEGIFALFPSQVVNIKVL